MTETTKEVPEQKLEPFHPTCANVSISGRNFVDPLGRILDLRGVNVGASSKMYVWVFTPVCDLLGSVEKMIWLEPVFL